MPKKQLSIYLLIILLGGLFWSRALLSMTLLIWAIIAFIQIAKTDPAFFKNPIFLWSICPLAIWFLGAWQSPFGKPNFDYLLTLTAYPAAVLMVRASPKLLVEKTWIRIWLIATAISLAYPLYWYFSNFTAANHAYGTGQSLPTFMDTDHVRFSIFLCSSFLFLLFSEPFQKIYKYIFSAFLLILILFLSVRTGWVILLVLLFMYTAFKYLPSKQNKFKYLLIGSSILLMVVVISYYSFPTIQQKLAYSIWEWKQFNPAKYEANFSDGTRRDINFVAWENIRNNFSINTGWQGISITIQKSFPTYFKGQATEFGWPFNQWLYWWMGSGWWGMLLFSCWLFFPAWKGICEKNLAIISWTIVIALTCVVETTLNYQYGVLLHIFPLVMLWKKSISSESDNS